jgi:predicted nucleic acid-binding protein
VGRWSAGLLRACQVREVDEGQAREAARLRAATGRAGTISAVDAVVTAVAGAQPEAVVLTGDPLDLLALAEHTTSPVSVVDV